MKFKLGLLLLACSNTIFAGQHIYKLHQQLNTSGARAVTPFKIDNALYLAVPQLAYDDLKQPANMNGGNADADVLIYKMKDNHFTRYQVLPGHGNESAAFFKIANRNYLATTSVDSGPKPPFNLHTYQKVYQWDGHYFRPIQQLYGYGAKGATAFSVKGKQYLGIASGIKLPNDKPNVDRRSVIYEWQGKQFKPHQYFNTAWGYEFRQFDIGNHHFLGLTDHLQRSVLYKLKEKTFEPFQAFDKNGGRVFYPFKADGKQFLAFANIKSSSSIYQWQDNKFKLVQILSGKGGRNFLYFKHNNKNYLLHIKFITGSRKAPVTTQDSPIYEYVQGKFKKVDSIKTHGGVAASQFTWQGKHYLAIANSLSKSVRYDTPSKIYILK